MGRGGHLWALGTWVDTPFTEGAGQLGYGVRRGPSPSSAPWGSHRLQPQGTGLLQGDPRPRRGGPPALRSAGLLVLRITPRGAGNVEFQGRP